MNKPDYIFGIRAVLEALEAGKDFEKIFIKKDLRGDLSRELMDALKGTGIPLQRVPIEKINRISRKNHQGVIAWVSPVEYQQIEQIIPMIYEKGEVPFILFLDGVTDVRNFGAIARTAECAGVHAIVVQSRNSAPVNADAVKTSAGALLKLPVCRTHSLEKAVRFVKDSGLTIFSASEKGDALFGEQDFSQPLALVMGSEDRGVSIEIQRYTDKLVKIPMVGTIKSLNVSVAAGVLIYEVLKQRLR